MERRQAIEREVKFEASMELELPDLRVVVQRTERLPERQFQTAYFDTADGRLSQRGLSLRHRVAPAESQGIWTLKLPTDAHGVTLDRAEVIWSGPRTTVPSDALSIVRGLVRRQPLVQRVVLDATRRRWALYDHNDVVAEIDDDVVVVIGGPRDGLRFRQIELELRPGGELIQDAVSAELERAGAPISRVSKLAKALGPLPHDDRPTLDTASSLGAVVRSAVMASLERLLDHDWRLRAASPTLEQRDVHQARVASRRLRSDLKTFRTALDPVWVDHVRDDLKWVGAVLGEVRDADVLSRRLGASDLDSHDLENAPAELGRVAARQREAATQHVLAALDNERYLDLLDRLHAASTRPPFLASGPLTAQRRAVDVLPVLVGDRWQALRRQVRKAGRQPSDHQLHRIRIKAKQLRYASEAAGPVVGKPARRTASAAEGIQTLLGEHHDAVATEAWLRQLTQSPAVESHQLSCHTAFEAGRLFEIQQQRQSALRRSWPTAWKRLARHKRRRWLAPKSSTPES